MLQPHIGKKSRANRASAIKLFLLIFLFCVISSNMILASSAPVSEAAGGDPSVSNPELAPDDSGLMPVYRKGMISAGLYHTVLLREDGRVYCWGDNSYGQLGTGTTENEESPTLVPDLVNIVMVQAGAYHTLALSEDGTVYAWGRNTFGQIGDGTSIVALKPTRIDSIPPMKEIAAGAFHSLALSIDGKVYAWGNNNEFQVGDVLSENIVDETGTILGKRVVTPQLVVESDAKAVSAGGNHSLYLRNDGQVFAWGSNKYGQLGDGSQVSRGLPAPVYGLSSGVTKISAGYSHNLAIKETVPAVGETQEPYQNLYVWGSDSDGQLGLGEAFDETRFVSRPTRVDITNDTNEKNDRISLIQAGYSNSMITVPVIKKEKRYDSIFIWGNNTYGQLGIGDLPSQNAPVPLIATSNGWTGSEFLPFQSVAIGGYHVAFLSVKGFVGIVGRTNKGQLGNVSSIDSNIPIGVLVPDAIAPEWPSNDKLLAAEQSTRLLLSWPEAKDNMKVTGYEVSYISTQNEMKDVELGLVNQYTVADYDRTSTQVITVRALDKYGNKSTVPLEYRYRAITDIAAAGSETGSSASDASQPGEPAEAVITPSGDSTLSGSFGLEESSAESSAIDEVPVITPQPADPLLWNPILYGTITPLEVPWNVDYLYGAGVVLPPKDYSWLIAVFVTIAIVSFFLFLGIVSFRKKHKGKRLFEGVFKEFAKGKPADKKPVSPDETAGIVHIGDGIDLVQDEDAGDRGETHEES